MLLLSVYTPGDLARVVDAVVKRAITGARRIVGQRGIGSAAVNEAVIRVACCHSRCRRSGPRC